MKKTYDLIDFWKLFFAVSIVALHTGAFRDFSPEVYFVAVSLFSRIAVPFFFCAGGFFLVSKWRNNEQPQFPIAVKQAKRALILYVVWAAIKMLYTLGRAAIQGDDLVAILGTNLLNIVTLNDSYYWYLQVQVVMTLLLGLICTTEKKMYIMTGFFALCYGILLFMEHGSFVENYELLQNLKNFFTNHDYIFKLVVGGLFLSIGGCVFYWKQKSEFCSKLRQFFGLFLGIVILILEIVVAIYTKAPDYDQISYFCALPIVAAFLLKLAVSTEITFKNAKLYRNLSILIYVTHYITRGLVSFLVNISYFVYFLGTLAISVIVGLIILKLSQKYKVFRWLY